MFTHKTEGNTLYIYRTRKDLYYGYSWSSSIGLLCFILGCLCFISNKYNPVILYSIGSISMLLALLFGALHYYYKKKLYTIKITKPTNGDIVIVNNTVFKNPQYLFNQAAFVQVAPHIIYLMHDKGDIHPVVEHILDKKDMYTMMDLIGNHLEIGVRKDD